MPSCDIGRIEEVEFLFQTKKKTLKMFSTTDMAADIDFTKTSGDDIPLGGGKFHLISLRAFVCKMTPAGETIDETF